jgi:hypothetical protein
MRTLGAGISEPEILDLIVSANVERRHLDPGQRAFLALDYKDAYAAVTKVGRPAATPDAPNGGVHE